MYELQGRLGARLVTGAAIGLACLAPLPLAAATPTFTDPSTTQSFNSAVTGLNLNLINNITFGTNATNSVQNLTQLAAQFDPYGIAGTSTIEQEWEIYQPFNSTNFVFTPNSLNLTAVIPPNGGLFPGGITSGQIWTQATFQPGVTGYTVYAMDVHMKIPSGKGTWPAAWLYSKGWQSHDNSEIDNPEFMVMNTQNTKDWTGFQHGPGMGADIFSRKTNKWVWEPGTDFSLAYHDYQLVWTPDAVYKYVDGLLIYAETYKWTSAESAQLGVNIAVGSSMTSAPGLQPTSLSEFPIVLSVDHISIWGK